MIPAGGINSKQKCWISSTKEYLFNQRNIATVFRARVLATIRAAGIILPPKIPNQWVADCQQAGHGAPTLKYLSRYLYRGVISEKNIIEDNGTPLPL